MNQTPMNQTTAHQNTTPVIEAHDVVTHYGRTEILHGVNLSVAPGEIIVIMGGSGSGKTTFLKALLGLLRPTTGAVRLLGQDFWALSDVERTRLRRRIGVAFQSGALFSSMSVMGNLMLPVREHTRLPDSTARILARMKLEVVDLGHAETLAPSELSGGMIKRAALARAMMLDPDILFCDEPSAGLDPVVASAIDDLLLTVRDATGMSIVVVTHELESAFKIADRICVLDRGNILMTGTVDEVRNADNARIQNLLNRRTEVDTLPPEAYFDRLVGRGAPGTGMRA